MSEDQQIEAAALAAATDVRQEAAKRAESHEGGSQNKKRPFNSPLLLAGLGLALVLFTFLNLTGRGLVPRVSEPSKAELRAGVEEELDLLVMEIETLADTDGTAPQSVDEWIPPGTDSWSYKRLGDSSFEVSMTLDGETAIYKSDLP